MRYKRIVFIFLLLSISWAVYSADFSTVKNPGKIVIARPPSLIKVFTFQVLINQEVLINLDPDEYFELTVDPGEYLLDFGLATDTFFGASVSPVLDKVESNKKVVVSLENRI